MSDETEQPETEIPEPEPDGEAEPTVARGKAPRTPWQIVLNTCVRHITVVPDGSAVYLHFTPAAMAGGQAVIESPQVMIGFSAAQWADFQREIAAVDVEPPPPKSDLAIVRTMPTIVRGHRAS